MTGFTSGFHHRDPEPWLLKLNNIGSEQRRADQWEHVSEPSETQLHSPRPEFDNHNPILVAFREYAALDNFGHVSHLIAHEVREHLAGRQITYEGCELIDNAWATSTQAQLEHACRVIDLLWQLTYPDDGYEEPAPEENFWDDRTTPLAYSEGDSKRDTIARRKQFAADLLPARYETLWDNTEDVTRLICRDCNASLAVISAGPLLDPLDAAIDHEAQAHW